jgi:hypothetical protein
MRKYINRWGRLKTLDGIERWERLDRLERLGK